MGEARGIATRRRFLAAAAVAGALGVQPATAAQPSTPAATAGARVDAPRWSFTLLQLQDPYPGTLQAPTEIPAGLRIVAAEIEVENGSDQPLDFTPVDVRLRDATGAEHRGGSAIGAEPMINPRNLNPGERSRGWVWFLVPEAAELVEIVYVAPPPQFRVPLDA